MRITIDLDDGLVRAALELTGARTNSEVVYIALQELVSARKNKPLTDLAGEIRFRSGFDYKAMRKLHE